MRRLLPLLLVCTLASAAAAQTPPAAPPADDSTEVSEVVVTARRPGYDPSRATTECLWEHLPEARRTVLVGAADAELAGLAQPGRTKMKLSLLPEAPVAEALRACGGPGEGEPVRFARTALIFFAKENAAARVLARSGMAAVKLERAWISLSPGERDQLVDIAYRTNQDRETDKEVESAAWTLHKLLRRLRPISAWNPAAYKAGSTNHAIVAYYAPLAIRSALEKRF